MKKLINDPTRVVPEMLEGLVALNPDLAFVRGEPVIVRADIHSWKARHQVAVISGGGSGHEPAHVGYVGEGMLTAAVCGEVFTSPSVDAVLAAIRTCATPAGVLLIVKNYTGDRLNFGLAAEIARSEGILTEMIIVADDAARATDDASHQCRGIAGTILVHKVTGAAAAAGGPISAVKGEAERAARQLGTMGVALSSCIIPAAGQPTFVLEDSQVEFGLGIHGEPGIRRVAIGSADSIVSDLIDKISARISLMPDDRVALLVNNLGGTPLMELAIVARRALQVLAARHVVVERGWCGTFLTALEMSGCSISILKTDPLRLARLDAPTTAPAWPALPRRSTARYIEVIDPLVSEIDFMHNHVEGSATTTGAHQLFGLSLLRVAEKLLAEEATLTTLDQAVGDGDLGLSMSRAGRAILENITALNATSPASGLRLLASLVRRVMGGSSGPLYSVALLRAATSLDEGNPSLLGWATAMESACVAISELGGAKIGDRTMLDALEPASSALRTAARRELNLRDAIALTSEAAEQAARATSELTPKLGRSAQLGNRAIGHPDPGAMAVAIWLRAIHDAIVSADTRPGYDSDVTPIVSSV